MNEGDAVIRLKSNRVVELVFAEDDETILREQDWHEQEVYKTAVQFSLMIDTFLRNGEGLDQLIMHSDTGSIAAELLGKDMLSISLAGIDEEGSVTTERADSDTETEEQEIEVELQDNVVDASTRFKKKDDNDEK